MEEEIKAKLGPEEEEIGEDPPKLFRMQQLTKKLRNIEKTKDAFYRPKFRLNLKMFDGGVCILNLICGQPKMKQIKM